jgi:hypothetical protein
MHGTKTKKLLKPYQNLKINKILLSRISQKKWLPNLLCKVLIYL